MNCSPRQNERRHEAAVRLNKEYAKTGFESTTSIQRRRVRPERMAAGRELEINHANKYRLKNHLLVASVHLRRTYDNSKYETVTGFHRPISASEWYQVDADRDRRGFTLRHKSRAD